MRKTLTRLVIFLLVAPGSLIAQTRQSKPNQTDPRTVFDLNKGLPDDKYFSREFALNVPKGREKIKNLTSVNFDLIIRSAPQSDKGCLGAWVSDGQSVAPLTQPTQLIIRDKYGNRNKVIAKPPHPVLFDVKTGEMLAIWSCCNKIEWADSKFQPPPPVALPVITSDIPKKEPPIVAVPERPKQVIVQSIKIDNRSYKTVTINKSGGCGKSCKTLIAGGIVAGAVIVITFALRGKNSQKPYPTGGVIRP